MISAVGIAVGLLFVLLVIPLVVPLPPLRDAVPPEELADPDSQFVTLNGVRVHYRTAGAGEPGFVLLHGFAASTFSWREVLPKLAERGRALAFDRPGFGLTERPLQWAGTNPYSTLAQVDLTLGLMERLGMGGAVLVGHSAGADTALRVALAAPDRVRALILLSPAVGIGRPLSPWVRFLGSTPYGRRFGPLFVRRIARNPAAALASAWHDPSRITPDVVEGYARALRAEGWDRGLWELTIAPSAPSVLPEAGRITVPVLIIVGENDALIPPALGLDLAKWIPRASVEVIPACGHVPHEERPEEVLHVIQTFLDRHGLLPEGR